MIAQAIELRAQGKVEEAISVLQSVLASNPQDPLANYHCAWCHDLLGREAEAVPFYEAAIAGGLAGDDLAGALLGLGSTYRTLGEYEKSAAVLRRGIDTFPDHGALRVFYSMTLHNLGHHGQAMELLLRLAAETSSDETVSQYRRAIEFYADKLDQTWK